MLGRPHKVRRPISAKNRGGARRLRPPLNPPLHQYRECLHTQNPDRIFGSRSKLYCSIDLLGEIECKEVVTDIFANFLIVLFFFKHAYSSSHISKYFHLCEIKKTKNSSCRTSTHLHFRLFCILIFVVLKYFRYDSDYCVDVPNFVEVKCNCFFQFKFLIFQIEIGVNLN